MGASDIRVTPSELSAAGAAVRGEAGRVREAAAALDGPAAAYVGEWNCGQALTRAELLTSQTVLESVAGLTALAQALEQASGTYSRADAVAVPGSSAVPG